MTPPDCWVPVPIRWRHVQPGDVVVGGDSTPWLVTDRNDPDATATVLIPASERDALTLTRDQLGAQVESRRLNPEQGAA